MMSNYQINWYNVENVFIIGNLAFVQVVIFDMGDWFLTD